MISLLLEETVEKKNLYIRHNTDSNTIASLTFYFQN